MLVVSLEGAGHCPVAAAPASTRVALKGSHQVCRIKDMCMSTVWGVDLCVGGMVLGHGQITTQRVDTQGEGLFVLCTAVRCGVPLLVCQ